MSESRADHKASQRQTCSPLPPFIDPPEDEEESDDYADKRYDVVGEAPVLSVDDVDDGYECGPEGDPEHWSVDAAGRRGGVIQGHQWASRTRQRERRSVHLPRTLTVSWSQ